MAAQPSMALAVEAVAVENADFSVIGRDGLPEGWYTEAWYDRDGDFAIGMERAAGEDCLKISNPTENDSRLCQSIPVDGGAYYRLECEVMAAGVSGGAGANISVVDTMAASEPLLGDSGWQRIELVGRTADDADEIIVCLRLGGYSALSSGEAWFRNFSATRLDYIPAKYQEFYPAQQPAAQDSNAHNINELHGGAMLLSVLATAAIGAACYKRRILPVCPREEGRDSRYVYAALTAALVLRCVLSLIFYGHSTDINCFMAWGNALAENGPGSFYTSGMFADYPPGYMYILWLLGMLGRFLGLSYGGAGHVLLIKMPAILADLLAAWLVYRLARRRWGHGPACTLMCFVAFNPAIAFISGGWGQIDQLTALLLLGVLALFASDRLVLAGLVYGIAIITKPQSLMAGPLLMIAYFARIHDGGKKYLLQTLAGVFAAVAAIFLAAAPFRAGQHPLWFIEKLLGTATSYPYASVEAFNFHALIGGNWKAADSPLLFLTYGRWGSIFIALSCTGGAVLYLKSRREKGSLYLSMAVTLAAIFTFGQYMHERYVFPVLLLIMAGFLAAGDRRLIVSYILYTCSLLLNVLAAFVVVGRAELRGTEYQVITVIGSILSLCAFGHLAGTVYGILIRRSAAPAFAMEAPARPGLVREDGEHSQGRFTRKDRIYCFTLTAAYAIVALINLGTLNAPESSWLAEAGDRAAVSLESAGEIDELRIYGGLYEGDIVITPNGGEPFTYRQQNGDMFRWIAVNDDPFTAGGFTIEVTAGRAWIIELAAFDSAGRQIPLRTVEGGAELTDEQGLVPAEPSLLNGMYFDELYHARTAYEHLHGLEPYENSHPPLGKVFIMLGVALFGMNTFGWRIAGALFGIAMLPAMYAFGKALFKRSDYALLAAGLMAVDFMHFAQSRIATIDVFAVFFIILMYYYMYRYYCMNFHLDGLRATLKPLAMAGVCFGLGAASKWIGIYAGGGLAVIFFTSLGKRYMEYRRLRERGTEEERAAVAGFWRNAVYTLLWCCLFYIAVPVVIYLASYIPYVLSERGYGLNGIWEIQEFMFSYHSGLTASHPFESQWWQWPLNLRPVWYYVNYYVKAGFSATISAFGNPLVWWGGSVAAGLLTAKAFSAGRRLCAGEYVLLVGISANYLPWVLVTRCTFAYHFFATLPFIILATVYIIRDMEERRPELAHVKWAYLCLGAILFALFYPVLSGLPVPVGYVRALEWLPGWTFMGY